MVAIEPRYCHQCGAALVTEAVDGRARSVCPDCGYRHFRNAIPAVVTMVRDGATILLIDPATPAKDAWELPGGHPEYDEEPVVAAARELGEETGLAAKPGQLSLLAARHSERDERHYVMIAYTLPAASAGGTLQAGPEADRVAFKPIEWVLETPARTRAIDRELLAAAQQM